MNPRFSQSARKAQPVARELRALCYAGLDSVTLRRRMSDALATAFQTDASVFLEIDPESALPRGSVLIGHTSAYCQHMVTQVYLNGPVLDFGRRAADAPGAVRLRDLQIDHDRDAYVAGMHEYGFRDDLQIVLRSRGRPLGFFSTMRRSGQRFLDDELALLDELSPHLSAGLRSASIKASLEAQPGTNVGIIVVGRDGRIEIANGIAEKLLRADPAAPATLWDGLGLVVAILDRALMTGANPTAVPALSMILRGRRYMLRAERGIGADGDPRTIILLDPPRREDSANIFSSFGLSPREAQIAASIVRGDTTATVAADIGISENTVKTHVRTIFDKLGVASRRELALHCIDAVRR